MNQPQLPPVQIPGDPSIILWIFFYAALLLTLGIGFGLLYHWFRYGYMYPFVYIMMPIWAVGTLILIGAMLAGIAAV